MKLSQLTKVMGKDEQITVCLDGAPIAEMQLYSGTVRGVTRDNPINKGFVTLVCACDDEIIVEIKLAEREGAK